MSTPFRLHQETLIIPLCGIFDHGFVNSLSAVRKGSNWELVLVSVALQVDRSGVMAAHKQGSICERVHKVGILHVVSRDAQWRSFNSY